MDRLISIGTERYHSELKEKMQILRYLLDNFNDGRRKSFFCMAANLLELEDLKSAAARKNIVLKLRKKEK